MWINWIETTTRKTDWARRHEKAWSLCCKILALLNHFHLPEVWPDQSASDHNLHGDCGTKLCECFCASMSSGPKPLWILLAAAFHFLWSWPIVHQLFPPNGHVQYPHGTLYLAQLFNGTLIQFFCSKLAVFKRIAGIRTGKQSDFASQICMENVSLPLPHINCSGCSAVSDIFLAHFQAFQ